MERSTARAAKPAAVTPHGQRTRDALLAAGRELAAADGLAGMTVDAVTARAEVAKGTFYVHFHDRDDFVRALLDAFEQATRRAIAEAVEGLPAGIDRALVGIEAYLDSCLRDPAVKALAGTLGGDGPSMGGGRFAEQVATNLRAAGWGPERNATARLVVAAVGEAAALERAAGRRDPRVRAGLARLLTGLRGG